MTEELKPCPFCGSVPTGFSHGYDRYQLRRASDIYVHPDCGCEYAIEVWSNRCEGESELQGLVAAHWNEMYRASGWISVEDRLPKSSGRYLVARDWYEGTWPIVVVAFNVIDLWMCQFPVTHWQPLPNLPK